MAAGPPCSLFIFLSSSVHKRHQLGPRGDESNLKVKLSNLLTENLAVCIRAVSLIKRVQVLLEQPLSSTMFALPIWQQLATDLEFESIETHMGFFGHFMSKPTTLFGNLEYITWLQRKVKGNKLRAALADKVKKNRTKFEKKLCTPLRLYVKSKGGSVSGGPDLALSAAYTTAFTNAVFRAWFRSWVLFNSASKPTY